MCNRSWSNVITDVWDSNGGYRILLEIISRTDSNGYSFVLMVSSSPTTFAVAIDTA